MYSNNKYSMDILIDLPNGLYTFISGSGDGKTRLFRHLRRLQSYGEPIKTYTYEDKQAFGLSVEDLIKIDSKTKVIMLDRYTMYNGDGAEILKECAKNSIVLIDCKQSLQIDIDEDFCFIEMGENSIKVTA